MDRINIDSGEKILLKLHKHWIILLRDTIGTIALGFLPFAGTALLRASDLVPAVAVPQAIVSFLGALWLLIVWLALAILWTNYYFDMWIVTDRRIFNIEQIWLFERRVATWTLDRIQEITVKHENFIETLLGYGTLEVETAGPSHANAIAYGIPRPEKVRTLILQQIGRIGKLEETTKKQEGLLRMIGHEVKGYLTKNAAALASITEGDYGSVPASLKTMANTALRETRKGVSTVMNILGDSDPQEGTVRLAKTRFDVKAAVTEVVESSRPDAKEKGLALEFIASLPDRGDGAFEVVGDETKLRELVFRNLVDNAIRYTPHGSVRVLVARSSSHVIFSVKDTGVGITRETMQKLFTEGGTDKDSKAINAESTGYGLFVAKSIVDAHGGRIWIESEGKDRGTQFFVELPAAA